MQEVPRKSKPHIGIITFRIDIRPINEDNTLNNHILQNAYLRKYNLREKGQFIIRGADEAECARKVMKIMEKINEQ
jgi:hypothetical protein